MRNVRVMRSALWPLPLLYLACAGQAAVVRPGSVDASASVRAKGGEPDVAFMPSVGERVAQQAAGWVGVASLRRVDRRVPDDCTGLVRLAYRAAGIELEGSAATMFELAQRRGAVHRKTPSPGDLVFFRETYDKNRDGRRNDGLTHVGVVESVDPTGTVTFVHRGQKGVARAKVNLRFPRARHAGGEVVNDYLRPREGKRRARLTGELFAGYASLERLSSPPSLALSLKRPER